MRDEDFNFFIRKMGEATYHEPVPKEAFERYRGVLPDKLLEYWQDEGWCGYADGRFWTVNPDDYADIVALWLEGTVFEQIDHYHAFARTGFGKLYVWGEKNQQNFYIVCPIHSLIAQERELRKAEKYPDFSIQVFFGGIRPGKVDLKDENGELLFEQARAYLGDLGPDEVYGFEPALVMGGRKRVENLQRVKAHQHLAILRQLAAPSVPYGGMNLDIRE